VTPEAQPSGAQPAGAQPNQASGARKRRRWPWIVAVSAAALAIALVVITRDNRHLEPVKAEMEALVGAHLAGPDYISSSTLSRWKATARIWYIYWTMPLPNSMVVRPQEDSWIYTFEAPEAFRPAATDLLACHGGDAFPLTCESFEVVDGWVYTVEFDADTGRGTFTARLVPE